MTSQKKYPFKFLDAYDRADRDLFFGREEEIEALYQMVFQSDLILICGASGTGKTSIIQCGLASKFQPYEWLALSIRRKNDINQSLEKALAEAAGPSAETTSTQPADNLNWLDEHPEEIPGEAISPLGQRLKNLYLQHFKPVFLIFDQFEELYILGSKDEQRQFIEHVREMLRIEQPVKIIISIREEYLGFLYEFERKVPELLRKKLRIEPMHLEKVQEVVRGMGNPARSLVSLRPGEEDAFGEQIFEKLRGRENVRTIELPYLQVLLDKLYLQNTGDETRKTETQFSTQQLEKMGDIGDLLANFLDDQVQKNARELKTSPETIKKLLAPFVTLDGTKEPLSAEMLQSRVADLDLPEGFIAQSLQAFQSSQILRFDEKEQRYEVKHDSLAKQIATYQDAEDVALQIAGQVIRTQMLMDSGKREVFTQNQLFFMKPHLTKLQPNAEEVAWIEYSITYWENSAKEELQRKQAELKAAQKRLRITLVLLSTALLSMLVAGYIGLVNHKQKGILSRANKNLIDKDKQVQLALDSIITVNKNLVNERDKVKEKEQERISEEKKRIDAEKKAEAERERNDLDKIFARIDEYPAKKKIRGIEELRSYLETNDFPNNRIRIINKISELEKFNKNEK